MLKDSRVMRQEYRITDELLEKVIGLKKIEANYSNNDKVLLQDYKKYPLPTDTKVKWNTLCFDEKTPHFELGGGRYLQKKETGGYMLLLYDTLREYKKHDYDVYYDEVIRLCGPFWVTCVYTISELKKLLDVIHVDYSNYKISKYIKENYVKGRI